MCGRLVLGPLVFVLAAAPNARAAQPTTDLERATPASAPGSVTAPLPEPTAVPVSGRSDVVAWQPSWKRFRPAEYALTGALVAGTAAFIVFDEDPAPSWTGPILFEKGVRNALRLSSPEGRRNAQTLGDAFYYGGLAYPFVVDVLAVALIAHQKPDVAAQMTLINAEAFAITGFLSFLSNATIRRERPYVRECGPGKPDQVFPDCERPGHAEGFFSGHTAIAYTGAALTCSHHANLPLYGKSRVGGTITCVAMLAGATVGGVARLYADKHYAADVIVGAGIGLASGFLVPWFHYRGGGTEAPPSTARGSGVSVLPVPLLSLAGGGVGVVGIF